MVAPSFPRDNGGMDTTNTFSKMWATRPPRIPKDQGGKAVIAGVAEGFGARFNIDPVIIRIAFVALTLCFGGGVFLYLLCWINMPRFGVPFSPLSALATGEGNVARESETGKDERSLAIWLLIGIVIFFPSLSYASDGTTVYSAVLTFALFGLGWYLLYQRCPEPPAGLLVPQQGHPLDDAHPSPAPDAGTNTGTPSESPYAQSATANLSTPPDFPHPAAPPEWDPLGAAPGLWHLPDPAEPTPEPAQTKKRYWLWIPVAIVATAAILWAMAVLSMLRTSAIGDYGVANVSAYSAEAMREYKHNIGEARIDLSRLEPLDEPVTVELRNGIGKIDLKLPNDVPFVVNCDATIGSANCPEGKQNADKDGELLTINVKQRIGSVSADY